MSPEVTDASLCFASLMRERYLLIDQCKRRSYLFSSDYSGLLENPVKTLTEFFCEYQRNEPETIVPGSPSVSFVQGHDACGRNYASKRADVDPVHSSAVHANNASVFRYVSVTSVLTLFTSCH
jgi:hypothetical protein